MSKNWKTSSNKKADDKFPLTALKLQIQESNPDE